MPPVCTFSSKPLTNTASAAGTWQSLSIPFLKPSTNCTSSHYRRPLTCTTNLPEPSTPAPTLAPPQEEQPHQTGAYPPFDERASTRPLIHQRRQADPVSPTS